MLFNELRNLRSSDLKKRLQAIRALGQRKNVNAVDGLVKLLDDSSVHEAAVKALGEIGSPNAVEPLLNSLEAKSRPRLEYVAQALTNCDRGWETDARAVTKLPLFADILEKCKFVSERWWAAAVLGNMGDERAIEALVKALGDMESRVRKQAKESLIQIDKNWPRHEGAKAAVPALVGKYPTSRDVELLEEIGNEPAVKRLIELLKQTKDEFLLRKAAKALIKRKDKRAIPALCKALGKKDLGKTAAKLLVQFGDEAVEPLLAALSDSDAGYYAKEALGDLGHESVRPLRELLEPLDQNTLTRLATGQPVEFDPETELRRRFIIANETPSQWQDSLVDIQRSAILELLPRLDRETLLNIAAAEESELGRQMEKAWQDNDLTDFRRNAIRALLSQLDQTTLMSLASGEETDMLKRLGHAWGEENGYDGLHYVQYEAVDRIDGAMPPAKALDLTRSLIRHAERNRLALPEKELLALASAAGASEELIARYRRAVSFEVEDGDLRSSMPTVVSLDDGTHALGELCRDKSSVASIVLELAARTEDKITGSVEGPLGSTLKLDVDLSKRREMARKELQRRSKSSKARD